MAQLGVAGAGAVAGAIVGSFVGMPQLGASVGWAIGGMAGALLFPPKQPDQAGPRLGDLTVQTSGYGNPIPVVAGHAKIAGQIIWKTDIEERVSVRRQRGKGGGGPKTTTYTYYCDFAVGICEWMRPPGNPQVLRIWLDTHLVYDTSGAFDITTIPGLVFRFYAGTEDQLPDPLIEAAVGSDNAPAHRGLAYLVFEDLPLDRFGNRVPNVTVELVADAVRTFPEVVATEPANPIYPSNTLNRRALTVDYARGRAYEVLSWNIYEDNVIRVYETAGMTTVLEKRLDEIVEEAGLIGYDSNFGNIPRSLTTSPDGWLYLGSPAGVTKIDPDGLRGVDHWTPPPFSNAWGLTAIEIFGMLGDSQVYLVSRDSSRPFDVIDTRRMEFVWRPATDSQPEDLDRNFGTVLGAENTRVVQGEQRPGETDVWFCSFPGNGATNPITPGGVEFFKFSVAYNAANTGGNRAVGISPSTKYVLDVASIEPLVTSVWPGAVVFDPTDNTLIIEARIYRPGMVSDVYAIKWDPDAGIVWATQILGMTATGGPHRYFGGTWGNISATLLETASGSALVSAASGAGMAAWTASFDGAATAVYGRSTSSGGRFHKVYINRLAPHTLTVGDIVQALCVRAGLEATDVDVSGLTDSIRGYTLPRPMSARDAITQLAAAFQFDAAEVDDVLVFRKRGYAPVVTIPYDDLVREDPARAVIEEQRAQDAELPASVTVRHADIDRGWDTGAQTWRRPRAPTATMGGIANAAMDLAIPLTASEAKTIARRMCIASWVERSRLMFSVGPKYARLVPTEPIIVTMRDGSTVRCRIISTEAGANGVIRVEAVTEDAATYSLTAEGDSGAGYTPDTMPVPYYTRLLLPDLALIEDGDDLSQAGLREYGFACPYSPDAWRGVTVFRSPDGSAWDQLGALTSAATWGVVVTAADEPPSPWTWDDGGEITVRLTSGELDSATDAEVLNWANMAALVGPDGSAEIIQFVNAAENPDGTWTLSRLLRGRRGTEDLIASRAAGDVFVLLDDTRLPFADDPTAEAAVRQFRAASIFETVATANARTRKAARGRAEMPYAVSHPTGSRDMSGNLTITWARRTRLGGEMLDGTGTVPLNEAAEAYEVDVLNGGTVVRTITGLSSPSATYSAANQTSDFGSPQAAVKVRIYQMSSIVGRGVAKEATV
jgi:hypothetical protein